MRVFWRPACCSAPEFRCNPSGGAQPCSGGDGKFSAPCPFISLGSGRAGGPRFSKRWHWGGFCSSRWRWRSACWPAPRPAARCRRCWPRRRHSSRSPAGSNTSPAETSSARRVRLLFPAMLPPVITLLNRPRLPARMAGAALAAFGLVTVILIGQRMPALLAGLGLLVGAWLLPQWRKPALLAVLAAVLVLVATPIISPPTAAKLLARFGEQMAHFATSAYGQLYIRAL